MGDHRIDGVYLTPKRLARLLFRREILQSWSGCCAYCGAPAGTLDHVKARARGGQSLERNLVACCTACNVAKGSMEWRSWFREQAFWCIHRERRIDGWVGTQTRQAA